MVCSSQWVHLDLVFVAISLRKPNPSSFPRKATPGLIGLGKMMAAFNSHDGEPRFMSGVTRILSQIEQGDPTAAEKLLPMVYIELRKLAAAAGCWGFRPNCLLHLADARSWLLDYALSVKALQAFIEGTER